VHPRALKPGSRQHSVGSARRFATAGLQRKYLQRTTSGAKFLRSAAGTGLGTTIKYLRCAAGIGLGTTIKYLQRSTSGAAGNGLCTTIKYLRGAV
jgi:hypothetical protein